MSPRHSWHLAKKDLLETRRDRLAALFTFVLPLVFTVFFGFILTESEENRLPVAVVDEDRGTVSQQLMRDLEASEVVAVERLGRADVDEAVEGVEVAAAVIIPQGFTDAVESGRRPRLEVVSVQGSSGAQSAVEATLAAAGALVAQHLAARAASETLGAAGFESIASTESARPVTQALSASPAVGLAIQEAGTAEGTVASGFEQSSPGMLINWILFSMLTVATGLVAERRNGTLRRLLTTRASAPSVITGKAFSNFVVALLQTAILVLAGQLIFGVGYLRSPLALILVAVTLALLASSLGLLLATLFRSEPAVIAATVILSMSLASLGGAWFPLEIAGDTFSTIGHLLPTTWLLDGLKGIILKGWGPLDVLPGVGIALAYTAVFYGIAAWRFRFE